MFRPIMKNKIIYFVKSPELGRVKTRLAASVGNHKAFAIYNLLLKKNWQILKKTEAHLTVEFTPSHKRDQIMEFFPEAAEYSEQSGKTKGDRMAFAFLKAINPEIEKVLLIRSDLADLQEQDIATAFLQLDENDIAMGPALNGGYYLIGFNRKTFETAYFQKIDWEKDDIFTATADLIRDSGNSIYTLPQRIDIDTIDDIDMFLKENKAENEFIVNLKKIISEV